MTLIKLYFTSQYNLLDGVKLSVIRTGTNYRYQIRLSEKYLNHIKI